MKFYFPNMAIVIKPTRQQCSLPYNSNLNLKARAKFYTRLHGRLKKNLVC